MRQKFGLSEVSLGRLIGAASDSMSAIENGHALPSDREFVRLCHVFGIYPHDLIQPSLDRADAEDFAFPDAEYSVEFETLMAFMRSLQRIDDPRARASVLDIMERLG